MNDYIWVVGGGFMQLPMIKEAKKRGYSVIVTDGSKSCDAQSVADVFYQISTYDEKAHAHLAKDIQSKYNIRAVVAPGVDVGPTVSAIAEVLDLPAVPYQVAKNVRNKGMMRLNLGWMKHPIADYTFTPNEHVVRRWNNFPCVVKPVDNCATRGITPLYEKDDATFYEAIANAVRSNKNANGVVIEEMLRGSEYALDFLIVNGEAVWVNGVTRLFRHHIPGEQTRLFGIEGAIVNPFVAPKELTDLATQAARSLGVTGGPFKIDAILDDRFGWCILETATRFSGGWDHMFLAPMTGRDVTSVLLDYSLGLEPVIPPVIPNRYSSSYVPFYKPMTVKRWYWGKTEQELKDEFQFEFAYIRSKDSIKDLTNCAERPIFVLARGDSFFGALRNAYRSSRFIIPIPEDLVEDTGATNEPTA